MQQYGFWRRQRGLAKSNNIEPLLFAYKDRIPTQLPGLRQFIDNGSSLFMQTVRNVPVLAAKMQALVSREVKETSIFAMLGAEPELSLIHI